jgi:sulfite exporter TauE/SafE
MSRMANQSLLDGVADLSKRETLFGVRELLFVVAGVLLVVAGVLIIRR